ncbi:MAG: DNA polymerase III subunit beta [Verrucomicrobia bacterium]|nr:DNA polymerase III subunit beta [Verrucomicrobiota bacterium]
MKLTIAKEHLIYGLQAVQNAVSERQTLPVLSNVLLRTVEDGLEITGTNMDLKIICTVKASVAVHGTTTLPARRFLQIVSKLPTPLISLSVNEKHQCTIESGTVYFKLFGLPAEDFPLIPQIDESQYVVLKALNLKKMVERTAFAMSLEDTRAVLNGLNFCVMGGTLTLVATDGRRMALCEDNVIANSGDGQCIIPSKTVSELKKLISVDSEVKVCWEPRQALFMIQGDKGSTIQLITKLMEGVYPNYKQVVPVELKHSLVLSREEFLNALTRAELMTSERSHVVKLQFANNQLTLTANSAEVGEAKETMIVSHEGPEISISFNPTFLMDPLKTLDDGEVFLEINDEFSPALLKTKEKCQFVVMPMRSPTA